MIEILVLSAQVAFLLFFSGVGFSALFLPKKLSTHMFWLSPWIGTIYIVMASIYLNVIGLSMVVASKLILLGALGVFMYSLWKGKITIPTSRSFLLVAVLTVVTYLVNISPLLLKVRYPTALSLGNLDVLAYVNAADYLINHTLLGGDFDMPLRPTLIGAADLITYGYRWGSSLIFTYFDVILEVRSYEIFTILLTLFFALSYPLVYVLTSIIYKKDNLIIAVLTFATYAINGTILYILYNVFIGQIMFVGLLVLLMMLFFSYTQQKLKPRLLYFDIHDILIAATLSSLMTIYPEGFYFAAPPVFFYYGARIFQKKSVLAFYPAVRIALVTALLNPFHVFTTFGWFVRMVKLTTSDQPIGWEPIRFATPVEVLGFHNIYYSRDFPFTVDMILAVLIAAVVFVGFIRIKNRLFYAGYIFVFIAAYVFYRYVSNNFFVYHRAITYSSFLYTVLFSIGVVWVLQKLKNRTVTLITIALILFFTIRAGHRSFTQFYHHYRVVDQSLISLTALNDNPAFSDSLIATQDIFEPESDLWPRLWRIYFLPDKNVVTRNTYVLVNDLLDETPLVLYEKNPKIGRKYVQFSRIIWENEYYLLGEVETFNPYPDLIN